MPAASRTPTRTPLLRRPPLGVWVAVFWLTVVLVRSFQRRDELAHLTNLNGNIEDGSLLVTALATTFVALLVFRLPLAALVVSLSGSVAAIGTGVPEAPVVLFLLAAVVIGYITATRSRLMSVAGAVLSCVVVLASQDNGAVWAALTAITFVAWLVGNTVRQSRTHTEALRRRATQQAVTEERLRIARELHDMVAHSIGIIAIQAGVGSRVMETQPAETRKALDAIEATSRETLSGLRRLLGALRETDTDGGEPPRDPAPGLADLGGLVTTTHEVGVRVEVRWKGQRRPLPPDIDLSAFRIVQEAVTNVVRHSGTRDCAVTLDHRQDALLVEVVDLGCGGRPPTASGGYGIVGMRERVSLLHGEFSAGPRPGGGFRVAARLPLPAGDAGAVATAETGGRAGARERTEPATDTAPAGAAGPAGGERLPGHVTEPASPAGRVRG
ncbi:sensor histidine kinase [Streptomyces sp. NPDC087270]|uniref:sensor histidine kinase n=1 Tax=Streptomyces sp. NPDC087270 TaxID=3365774 RepID=UPI003817DFDC